MKSKLTSFLSIIGFITAAFFASAASAADHKVVIQVSSADPMTQSLALNVASNVQKHYGIDHVAVELVAFGPGLSILTKNSKQADRIASLSQSDIKFSACGNTIKKITKKTGKAPALVEGVSIVDAGAVRLIELQEQGYSYLRP